MPDRSNYKLSSEHQTGPSHIGISATSHMRMAITLLLFLNLKRPWGLRLSD